MSAIPILKRADSLTGRFYTLPDGTKLPSVTTILSVISKPALVNWAAKTEREMVVDVSTELYEEAPATPKMSAMGWKTTLEKRLGKAKAHRKLMEKAADIGSAVHNRVEWELRKEMGQASGDEPQLKDEALWAYMTWEEWRRQIKMKPIYLEQMVYNKTEGYAGTLDLCAVVDHPELGLVHVVGDWKTSKRIYWEARLQIAAYAHALRDMGHFQDVPLAGLVIRVSKNVEANQMFESVFIAPDEIERYYEAFLHAKRLWVAQAEHEAEEKRIAAGGEDA